MTTGTRKPDSERSRGSRRSRDPAHGGAEVGRKWWTLGAISVATFMLLLGRGAATVGAVAAGTPVASGDRPRLLIEAGSSGTLGHVAGTAPPALRNLLMHAGHEGFLAGLNAVLTLGALVALAGAVLALALVREREIERTPVRAISSPE